MAETQVAKTTGPGAWLERQCVRFDRLLSLDHNPARQNSEEYDEAFHDAVHALKDVRGFARAISPTWVGTSTHPYQWLSAHGCLTGDCPHEKQADCNASLAQAYRELAELEDAHG